MRFVISVLITIAFILAIYYLATRIILPIFGIELIPDQQSSNSAGLLAFQYGLERDFVWHAAGMDCSVSSMAGEFKGSFDKPVYT